MSTAVKRLAAASEPSSGGWRPGNRDRKSRPSGHHPNWVLLVFALVGTLTACAPSPVPRTLADHKRIRMVSGERAAALVARLHGRKVAPRQSVLAEYGRGAVITVWLATFASNAEAQRTLGSMIGGIKAGRSPYASPWTEPEEPSRFLTFGPGGEHALWVSGRSVYWLQAAPELFERALAELPPPTTGTWT
jgi:hypothetical protein